jgi:alpha-L-rhamnosidase
MIPTNLRCAWLRQPTVDVAAPRLTWELRSPVRGDAQTAYQIQCGTSRGGSDLWDAGKIVSAAQRVVYAGAALASRSRVFWRVRVWNAAGVVSQWADATFGVGLRSSGDWGSAAWIGYQTGPIAQSSPAAWVRKAFTPTKPVARAVLYATARGTYVPWINGQRIGQEELAPGWTTYSKRHHYQAHDVTRQIVGGLNALGFEVGDGWYHGNVYGRPTGNTARSYYGADMPRVIAVLYIDYTDGTSTRIETDASWVASTSAIQSADIYNGAAVDGRVATSFTAPGLDTSLWKAVTAIPIGSVPLTAQTYPPIRRQSLRPAVAVTNPRAGTYVFDFGALRAGSIRLRVDGAAAGQKLTVAYSEDLFRSGPNVGMVERISRRNAGNADTATCRGAASETFDFPMTYRGFRYAEVTGYPGVPPQDALAQVQLFADRPKTIAFESSDNLLNRLFAAGLRSHEANSMSIMSDCPYRDERLGWNGDGTQAMTSFLFQRDNITFLGAMLDRIQDDVDPQGRAPITVPDTGTPGTGSAGGGELSAFLPAYLYLWTGDPYFMGQPYIGNVRKMLTQLPGPATYGDYLETMGTTDSVLFSNAWGYRVARVVQQAATAVGDTTTANQAATVAATCLSAAQARINPDGSVVSGTQGAYAVALAFGVVPAGLRKAAAGFLADLVAAHGITAGLVGYGFLFDALSEGDRTDAAYAALLRTTAPSMGYDVLQGLTTVAEYVNPLERQAQGQTYNSFCHQIKVEFVGWIIRTVGGINYDPAAPGFANILLRPIPGGGLTWQTCQYDSPRGPIESSWRLSAGRMAWTVRVPAGATATISLPPGYATISEAGTPIVGLPGVAATSADPVNGRPRWTIPSGFYSFEVK